MSEVKYLSTTGTQTLVNKIKDYVDNKEVSATIEDGSITTSKLANSAVTASKIAAKTITNAEIENGTIVPKLLADSVGPVFLNTTSNDGTIGLSDIYIHGSTSSINFSSSSVPSNLRKVYDYYTNTASVYLILGIYTLPVYVFQINSAQVEIVAGGYPARATILYKYINSSWVNKSYVEQMITDDIGGANNNLLSIASDAIVTDTIKDKAVTPDKLSDEARYFPAVASTNSSTTLLVGNFNNLGTISSNTTVTLDTPTIDSSSLPDDYTCVWEGGFTKSSGCTVTFPSDITWVGDTLESSSTGDWEFSIRKIGSSYHGILVNFS